MPYLNFYTAEKGTYWCRVPLVADRSDAISPYSECPTLAVRLNDTTYYAYVQKNNGSNAVAAFRHGGETYWLVNRKGGMDEGVWRVFTPEDLMEFREWAEEYSSYHTSVAIMNDIDMSDCEWTPFGTADNPYTGTFSGNGYTIKGLKVSETLENMSGQNHVGLFGRLGSDAVVDSLNVEAEVIVDATSTMEETSRLYVGGIAGGSAGVIRGCSATVTITASFENTGGGTKSSEISVGGIVGSGGAVSDCESSGTITVDATMQANVMVTAVGGIIGLAAATVSNCVNRCDVQVSASNGSALHQCCVGGVIGWNYYNNSDVSGLTNYGNVSMTYSTSSSYGPSFLGSVIGCNDGSYSDISNYGTPADVEVGGSS